MRNAPHIPTSQSTDTHAERHAYNAAFDELGLAWFWDAATYARLTAQGANSVRRYLEAEQPHLLRAYDADFLVDAVEAARMRRSAGTRQAA